MTSDAQTLADAPAMQQGDLEAVRKGSRRAIIHFSVAGIFAQQLLSNNVLLVYLASVGFDSSRVVFYLALPFLLSSLMQLPFAHLADRYGRKRIGGLGRLGQMIGFGLILLSVFLPEGYVAHGLIPGLVVYGMGQGLFLTSWFVLIKGSVPEHHRGRFFGLLRLAWQTAGLFFTIFCVWMLSLGDAWWQFAAIFTIAQAGLIANIWFYNRIVDLEPKQRTQTNFFAALLEVMRYPKYFSFCSYIFLLKLFTMCMPVLFALVEKQVLGWPDDRVVLMQFVFMIGAIGGYMVGGHLVDRIGTRPVFTVAHVGFAMIVVLFFSREMFEAYEQAIVLGAVHFLFGLLLAVLSIAIATEMLALMPPCHQSIGSSVGMLADIGGTAISSLVASYLIYMGLFKAQWTWLGWTLSEYDGILFVFGLMVLLLVVTLGLVPSVISPSRWIPKGGATP